MKLVKLLLFVMVFGTFSLSPLAAAQTSPDGLQFAVFPFVSSEPRLGVAVADRLTHAFTDASIPPELSLGLVPPLLLEAGTFISPLNLLGDEGTASRFAAAFLREALHVDTAVTGKVQLTGAGLELKLFVARPDGTRSFLFRAPDGSPERLVAQAQGALRSTAALTPKSGARLALDLSSPYGTFVDGLVALGGGFPEEALPLLRRAGAALRAEPRWRTRAEAVQELLSDRPNEAVARYPLLAAVVALNTQPFSEQVVTRAFADNPLPLAALWRTLLAVQAEDDETARAGFTVLSDYPYAESQRLLYRLSEDGAGLKTDLQTLQNRYPDALSVLVSGLFLAQGLGDRALEQTLATRLSELAPAFAYPYERLSQLAFDRDDPQAAAVALRTATRLEPQSDLYFTNLGWAYYLLGALGASETASEEALRLNPGEVIALYNLGLVQTVTGRLGLALGTYAQATDLDLQADDQLDPAATEDLQNALDSYPDVPSIYFALGTLLEVEGKIGPAAAQFERYAAEGKGPLVAEANARVTALRAPAPPLRLAPVQLGVGAEARAVADYIPGDLLYARFELSTPGDALLVPLEVALKLEDKGGTAVSETSSTERAPLPPNTVALEITDAALPLPQNLKPGRYALKVSVRSRGRTVRAQVPVTVSTRTPSLVRQLIGRGVTLRGLTTGSPLYPDGALEDGALVETLLAELSRASAQAAETLPEVVSGRFAGQGGAAVFGSSREQDVRDFLSYVLQTGENTDGAFAELYARWALAGAPLP